MDSDIKYLLAEVKRVLEENQRLTERLISENRQFRTELAELRRTLQI